MNLRAAKGWIAACVFTMIALLAAALFSLIALSLTLYVSLLGDRPPAKEDRRIV